MKGILTIICIIVLLCIAAHTLSAAESGLPFAQIAGLMCLGALLAGSSSGTQEAVTITVNAATDLGSSANLDNWIACQNPPAVDRDNPDPWVLHAWTDVGFQSTEAINFFNGGDKSVRVTRNSDGGLDLDFTAFDDWVNFCRNTLGCGNIFGVKYMPKAVAFDPNHENYSCMSFADPDEWYEIVRATVSHIKNDLGIPGADYYVWGEPHYEYFIGKARPWPDTMDRFHDFMELYTKSWFAVKAADLTARVGFPGSATCSHIYENAWGGIVFGLEDMLKAIAQDRHTGLGIDIVSWQDHNWTQYPNPEKVKDGSSLSDVLHIRDVLRQNGLPADLPQAWVGGWSDDFLTQSPREHIAAHIASNIIEHTQPGSQTRVERGGYYDFDAGVTEDLDTTLVSHPGRSGGGPYEKRQGYAAFQVLHDMEAGTYVRCTQTDDQVLRAMAIRNDDARYVLAAVNYMTGTEQKVTVVFKNLPAEWNGRDVELTIKRIDAVHSADGSGLEPGLVDRVKVTDRTATVTLEMPENSIRQIILAHQ